MFHPRAPVRRFRPGSLRVHRRGRRRRPTRDVRLPRRRARWRCKCPGPAAGRRRSAPRFRWAARRRRRRPGAHARRRRGSRRRPFHRLVEAEQHEARALLEHRVVGRFGCQRPCVRTGRRCARERRQHCGDRDEHRPARTTARIVLHLSSLRSAARSAALCSARGAGEGRARRSRGRGPAGAEGRRAARTG